MGRLCCESLLCWVAPGVWRAARYGRLEPEDVPPLPHEFSASVSAKHTSDAWLRELKASKQAARQPRLSNVLWALLRFSLITTVVCGCINGLLTTAARPLLLRSLITNAEDHSAAFPLVAALALELLAEGFTTVLTRHHFADRFGAGYVAALANLLFQKSLRLSPGATLSATSLIGNDVPRTYEMFKMLAWLMSAAVGLLAGVVVLLATIGYISLVGIAVFGLILTINAALARCVKAAEHGALQAADKRIAMVSRIINCIRAIKLSAWEPDFLKEVTKLRQEECRNLRRYRILAILVVQLGRCSPIIAYSAVFLVMGLQDELSAVDVFPALIVFQGFRVSLIMIPTGFVHFMQLEVSFHRVRDFLLQEEATPLNDGVQDSLLQKEGDVALAASIRDASFKWHLQRPGADTNKAAVAKDVKEETEADFALTVPQLDLPLGSAVGILGKVGCGKSSLLNALLGNLTCVQGRAALRSSLNIAYVMQRAFIVAGTIEENILMGRDHDEPRLAKAIAGACLDKDLELMPHGLLTEIGERGVTLSGGQQQRVAIARALYTVSPAVLVFDDPLAAVDTRVAGSILKAVLARRAEGDSIIMALNQLSLVEQFDQVCILQHGALVQSGEPTVLLAEEGPLRALLDEARQGLVQSDHAEEDDKPPELPRQATRGVGKLIAEETRGRGGIKAAVFAQYVMSMGVCRFATCVTVALAGISCLAFSDRWLATWIKAEEGDDDMDLGTEGYATIYVCVTVLYTILSVMASIGFSISCVRASQNLHDDCMGRLLRAPVAFHEETPAGRILSRMSGDISMVDLTLGAFLDHGMMFVGSLLQLMVTIVIVAPPMFAIFAPCFIIYFAGVRAVERTSRELKRLFNIAQSPVLSLVGEASQGRLLLRVMGLDAAFTTRFQAAVDDMQTPNYNQTSTINWALFMSYLISTCISTATAVFLLLGPLGDDAALLGLGLGYALQLPYFMLHACFVYLTFRSALTALERLLECKGDGVPQEAAWSDPADAALPAEWPRGSVSFDNATLCYRPGLAPALKSISFSVAAGEKVGVVGRTGAGKSSLVQLLFRLRDANEGVVLVDGQDIAHVGLHRLRQGMAVIPQESLLLEGSVRDNIDPFHSHEDAELEDALARVGFPPQLLDEQVGSAGRSLSHGQHQLLALARALLRHATMVVLDEPTSSVDAATDLKVQQALREAFVGRTVFTVAHRLATIIDSDKVLVMDAGEVAEFGPPGELYNKEGGTFSTMARAAGVKPSVAPLDTSAEDAISILDV